MTRVVRMGREDFDVFIGRPSEWGNPFVVGRDGTRLEVIEKFRRWLTSRPERVAQARRELKGKRLGCFCHPEPCHGDVLVEVCESSP